MRAGKPPVLVLDRCRHRLCPLCSTKRSWKCAREIEGITKQMDSPRFITLTIATDDSTLSAAVAKLRDGWKRLRQTKLWKGTCEGGVYVLEVTRGRRGDRWHPHLHIVVDGSFISQKHLSDTWLRATGDSCIVDVRAIRSRRQIARYISKYLAKGTTFDAWTEGQIAEYAVAMDGQRTVQTFGTMHGRSPDPRETEPLEARHHQAVPWGKLVGWAKAGWAPACKVYSLAPRLGVDWRTLTNTSDEKDAKTRLPLIGPELRGLNEALGQCIAAHRWEIEHPGQTWQQHAKDAEAGRRRLRRRNAQRVLEWNTGADASAARAGPQDDPSTVERE
jgi:hypothetical protein